MQPDLEPVPIGQAGSFRAWEHGDPFRTLRWHFHPECGLHGVASTAGRDFVGSFGPGTLVLTRPNVPHTSAGETVPPRARAVPYTASFAHEAIAPMPELAAASVRSNAAAA